MLPFLFCLEPETSQPAQVFLADGLVHCGTAPDTFAVVVGDVRPPVRLYYIPRQAKAGVKVHE